VLGTYVPCEGVPPPALVRPPVEVVRFDVSEAVEARVDLVAIDTVPAGTRVRVLGSTVTDEGRGSHSEDMWKDPRWRLRCNP
jgi:hypothetical protein